MTAKRGLLLGGVGVVAVLAMAGAGMAAFQKPTPPQYLTQDVAVADVEKAVLATGSLQPYEVINVGSQTNGQVLAVNVKLGDHVVPGQAIAQIDPAQLQNQLRNAETRLAERKAQVGMVTANLAMNQANVTRQTKLRDAGVGSVAQYEQAQAQMRNNQANVQQFENQVKTAETEVELAKINLDKATIRAPIDGIVAEIVTRQGQTVNTNQGTPTIVKLAKMDVMSVRAQVSEADITKVKPGQKVYFTLLGDPEKRYYATLRMREVTPAGGVLDPGGSGPPKGAIYYNALFEVPNPTGELLPAMTAEVHVVLGEAKRVLTVPLTALGARQADGRYRVRVIGPDGLPQDRTISIGLANSSLAEVKEGLRVGERVVIGEASAKAGKARAPLFSGLSAPKL
jgi:macrolide-specific efflux system membrane fusion protein